MNILADTQKIVIYTPAQDFLYNSDVGANLAVIVFTALISILVGCTLASATKKNWLGWLAGLGLASALIKVFFL